MNANEAPAESRYSLPAPLMSLVTCNTNLDEEEAFVAYQATTAVLEADERTWTDVVEVLNEIGGPITRYATTEPPFGSSERRFSRAMINHEPIPPGGYIFEFDLNVLEQLWSFVELFMNHYGRDIYRKKDFVFVVRFDCWHCAQWAGWQK